MPVIKPSLPLWLNVFIITFDIRQERIYYGFVSWGVVPSLLAVLLKQTLQSENCGYARVNDKSLQVPCIPHLERELLLNLRPYLCI